MVRRLGFEWACTAPGSRICRFQKITGKITAAGLLVVLLIDRARRRALRNMPRMPGVPGTVGAAGVAAVAAAACYLCCAHAPQPAPQPAPPDELEPQQQAQALA